MTTDNNALPLEIAPLDVKSLTDAGDDFFFVDCREPDEYAIVRLDGTTLIPMNETPGRLNELADYRDKRIVVHCHHGGRSLQVAQWLRMQGFSGAQNMTGGIDQWSREVDASLPRY